MAISRYSLFSLLTAATLQRSEELFPLYFTIYTLVYCLLFPLLHQGVVR